MKKIAALALVAILSLTGCMKNTTPGVPSTPSIIPGLLEAALDAAAAAYATINPSAAPTIALVTECGSAAVAELQSSDSGAVKATKIAAACAAALTAAKAGGPTLQIVASALDSFLNAIIPLESSGAAKAIGPRPSMTIESADTARITGKIATLNAKLAKR